MGGEAVSTEITRCKKCILPESYPGIQVNDEGICTYCVSYDREQNPSPVQLKAKLDALIEHSRGKGRYDVAVGLSGGKDSSYVAYYLRREYGVKIVGINFDNGYRSDIAVRNLEKLVDALHIDLITIRPSKAYMKKLFSHFLRTRGEFCSVCNNLGYLFLASFMYAQKRQSGHAPLGVGGWSKKYEYQPNVSVTSMQYFFNNLSDELTAELLNHPFIEEQVVRAYMALHDPRRVQIGTKEHEEAGPHVLNFIQLPDYIPWDLREIPKILKRELGWEQPPDTHDSHFDCTLFPIKEYLKFRKYGLTQETIKNSVLIREGLMTRQEALDRMRLEQTEEPDEYTHFLRELGLSRDEVNEKAEWSTR